MQNAVLFSKTATQNGMEQTLGILDRYFKVKILLSWQVVLF